MKFKTLNNCAICNKPKERHNTSLGIYKMGYGFHHWIQPGIELQRVRMRLELQKAIKSKENSS